MLQILCLVIALTAAATAHAAEIYTPDSWQKAYALRQIKLGMTLDNFRKVDPDGNNVEGPSPEDFIVCSRDEIASAHDAFWALNETSLYNVGVTKCAFYYRSSSYVNTISNTSMGFGTGFGLTKSVKQTYFYFIRPSGAPSAYLFRIEADVDPDLYYQVRSGITKKYGTPKVSREAVQNGFGAMFQNETSVWNNGISRIKLQKYDFDLLHGEIVYELNQLKSIFDKRIAADNPEPENRY